MQFFVAANAERSRTTGLGRQMFGMAEALEQRGHEVDLVFRQDLGLRLGTRWSRLEYPLRAAAHVYRRARPPAAAIIHEPAAWATSLLGRARGVRTYAMVHNAEIKVWRRQIELARAGGAPLRASSRVLWPLTELSQTWLSLRSAHHVLTLSTEDRRFVIDEIGVPEARVTRIDNGVEQAFVDALPAAPTRERDVLFLASWLPHKGTAVLISALEALASEFPRATLTIAGVGGPEEPVRAALPASWRSRTDVIRSIEPAHLPALYARHRIFVLPSFYEGIPLSLLEAMTAGLAPVVSAVGGIVDVVDADREAVLVPAGDAAALAAGLRRLLRDPSAVETLGRAAARRSQGLRWANVAQQVEAIAVGAIS